MLPHRLAPFLNTASASCRLPPLSIVSDASQTPTTFLHASCASLPPPIILYHCLCLPTDSYHSIVSYYSPPPSTTPNTYASLPLFIFPNRFFYAFAPLSTTPNAYASPPPSTSSNQCPRLPIANLNGIDANKSSR